MPIKFDKAEDLASWSAEIPGKVDLHVEALTGPTADPNRRVTTANAPGAEVGPGQIATWGVVKKDHSVGFEWSHEHSGGSSKHFPFDWRPDGAVPTVSDELAGAQQGGCCCSN
ncbi:Uncharacterized conserved protein [Mycobacteroides abscessus subsp. abscessus]|nr:Uncharacterized conserved protein [Mycobacteroides abscessus subsp. abscessus]